MIRTALALAFPFLASFSSCASAPEGRVADLPDEVRLLVEGERTPVLRSFVYSTSNANDRFEVLLEIEPRESLLSPYDAVLWLGGERFSVHGTGSSPGKLHVQITAGSADAERIAGALGVVRQERRSPGHRLAGRLEVVDTSRAPETLPVRFHLANVGAVPIRFLDGGRGANERGRDERFRFEIERGGGAVEPIDVPSFGGLAVSRVLAPGQEHVFELDLANWATIDAPGDYRVRGRYEIEIQSEALATGRDPFPLHAHESWDDVVEASFELRVGG